MRVLGRFGGIMVVFALMIGFGVLGFAVSQPGLLFIALLCWWPLLIGVAAWTARGLRDHYQLVPKGPVASSSPRVRQRQAIPEEF